MTRSEGEYGKHLTHEKQLIAHHTDCAWNKSGFGSHDYGRQRDATKPNDFDLSYPVEEMRECVTVDAGPWEANKLLLAIKEELPYTFRYQTDKPRGGSRGGSATYNGRTINVPESRMPALHLLQEVVNQFPPGWQGTVFSGHMILYKENQRFPHSIAQIRQQPLSSRAK